MTPESSVSRRLSDTESRRCKTCTWDGRGPCIVPCEAKLSCEWRTSLYGQSEPCASCVAEKWEACKDRG